jgi:carbon storage regulator
MLVITRKLNQKLYIGGDIVITVVAVKPGGAVQIGIEAPREISVLREEAKLRTSVEQDTQSVDTIIG